MSRKIILFAAMFFSVAVLSGCASLGKSKDSINPSLLEPQAMTKFSDVPVPVGLKLVAQDSYCFETSGMRVGLLKYHGKGNADLIVNFYREQMGMYNWNLLNVIEYGQRLMNFDRETETCTINITPKGNSVELVIAVGPKSQSSTKRSKAVVK